MVLNFKQDKYIRNKNYHRIINKKIQNYIKNPVGNLNLFRLPINKLPNDLKYVDGDLSINNTNITELPEDIIIEGSLWCYNTPLRKKYSKEEIKKKYNIKGKIYGI